MSVLAHLKSDDKTNLSKVYPHFLDVAGLATARATHDETKEEVIEATKKVHESIFGIDRGIYGITLALPGVTEFNKQMGMYNLLSHPVNGSKAIITEDQEFALLSHFVKKLKVTTVLRTFMAIKDNKVNNSRTRRLILKTLFEDPDRFEFWAVKYRDKLQNILKHVWNERTTGIIKSILDIDYEQLMTSSDVGPFDEKERGILTKNITKYSKAEHIIHAYQLFESISFILGNTENKFMSPLFQKFFKAKVNIKEGVGLPYEVLDGIRRAYHKGVEDKELLELAKDSMSERQKKDVQTKAEKAGVAIKVDLTKFNLVELYIYAYEKGMTEELKGIIDSKIAEAGKWSAFNYKKIGIVLDTSRSMFGHGSQKLRPIAIAQVMSGVLQHSSESAYIELSDEKATMKDNLIQPKGETNLAKAFAKLFVADTTYDAVFIITDGNENAPAGRLDQTITLLKKIVDPFPPVYQITPTLSAEGFGIKSVSDQASKLPISNPENTWLPAFKAAITADIDKAIELLMSKTLPLLTDGGK